MSVVDSCAREEVVTATDYPQFAVDGRATRKIDANRHGCSDGPRIGCDVVDIELVKDVVAIFAAGHVDLVIYHPTSHSDLSVRQRRQRSAPGVGRHIIGINRTGMVAISETADEIDLAIGISVAVVS